MADGDGDERGSLAVAAALDEYLRLRRRRPPAKRLRRSDEALHARLAAIAVEMTTASTLRRVDLVQERLDVRAELDERERCRRLADLEPVLADGLRRDGRQRQGSGGAAGVDAPDGVDGHDGDDGDDGAEEAAGRDGAAWRWRAVGVPADVLRRAGMG